MKKLFSILFIILQYTSISSDEFVTVEKCGVRHKFCKMNDAWLDQFISYDFQKWENDTFEVFQKVKNPKGTAIDLGAWIGTTSIWLAKNFAHVIIVEADKNSLIYLKKNLEASNCKNTSICEKAISNQNKFVVFGPRINLSPVLNSSTSCVKKLTEAYDSKNNYIVSSITLSQIVDQYMKSDFPKISFIKCDIEGGEEGILKDILEFSSTNKCDALISFHYDWWSNKNIDSYAALFDKFNTNLPLNNVCEFVKNNPYGSVLFSPK
ncbi:MAG: FkbM family methyltransferase [Parachlamydiaceae bacterium]|nr:FkbM family methyltransferase [Parachlamydiaceae bacterium]